MGNIRRFHRVDLQARYRVRPGGADTTGRAAFKHPGIMVSAGSQDITDIPLLFLFAKERKEFYAAEAEAAKNAILHVKATSPEAELAKRHLMDILGKAQAIQAGLEELGKLRNPYLHAETEGIVEQLSLATKRIDLERLRNLPKTKEFIAHLDSILSETASRLATFFKTHEKLGKSVFICLPSFDNNRSHIMGLLSEKGFQQRPAYLKTYTYSIRLVDLMSDIFSMFAEGHADIYRVPERDLNLSCVGARALLPFKLHFSAQGRMEILVPKEYLTSAIISSTEVDNEGLLVSLDASVVSDPRYDRKLDRWHTPFNFSFVTGTAFSALEAFVQNYEVASAAQYIQSLKDKTA